MIEPAQLNESIGRMTDAAAECLNRPLHSFLLYGSVVFNDFRPGWSDVDFIAFTDGTITEEQAAKLLTLRQSLGKQDPYNPYYRAFEGVIANLSEFRANSFERLVYWGTSGQRITNRCEIDPFARYELAKYGVSICGDADPGLFTVPTHDELAAAVRAHYNGIRRCAVQTDESLYSCGWLLDIARCIYTLRYGEVIAKTRAGEWALSEHLFPDEDALKKTLAIRRDPDTFKNDPHVKAWLGTLGPVVQRCADILERELANYI